MLRGWQWVAFAAVVSLGIALGCRGPQGAASSPSSAPPPSAESRAVESRGGPALEPLEPLPGGRPIKVTLAISSVSPSTAVWWVTKEGGYFEKHGLDVETPFIEGGTRALQSLVGGDLHFAAITGADMVNAAAAGADIVQLGSHEALLSYQLIVNPAIQKVEDLKGKKLAVSGIGSSSDVATRILLARLGLKADEEVAILQVGSQSARFAAIQTGQIDGSLQKAPFSTEAQKLGFNVLVDGGKLNIPYPGLGPVTTRRFVSENRDMVRRFIRAYVEGIHRYKRDPELVKNLIADKTGITDPDALAEAHSYYAAIAREAPYALVEAFANVLEELGRERPQLKSVTPASLVDNSFVEELDKGGFIRALYGRP